MTLLDYFENTKGSGVLATANSKGDVDVAIYARPHVIDEENIAFIMNERLSYHNIVENPKAAYIFQEDGPGYQGKRLYLTKTRQDSNPETINAFRRKCSNHTYSEETKKHLVYFHIDKIRKIIDK
ncbi:MAG: pyridoxamine 5'-phosphate oxidase family protein [Phycisphaerae bacterium]|nr:pyridoxamine 5'-phosphate oxidase family protein [Phycisphaerae bacterium]